MHLEEFTFIICVLISVQIPSLVKKKTSTRGEGRGGEAEENMREWDVGIGGGTEEEQGEGYLDNGIHYEVTENPDPLEIPKNPQE